jgi:hypothetical protein
MNENRTPAPQDTPVDTPPPPVVVPEPLARDSGLATRDFVRRRGAPVGNQNARKHGLYAKYLSGKQLQDYNEACGVRGVESELALFRCKLAEMVETEPWNWVLLNRIANTILKLEAALPEESPEAEAASRSTRIISGYFTYALAAGDEHVTKAFNKWMEKNHPVEFVPENKSHVQPEADSA